MLRRWEGKAALLGSVLSLLVSARAAADNWPQSTCTSYIRSIELSAKYNDPYLNQFYLDLADDMYARMNQESVARGMKPLAIVVNADAQTNRAMVVVNVCKTDMSETYAEAVSKAYIKMREASGLSVRVPHQK